MKAIRLIDCVGPNPAYSRDTARAARRQGVSYDVSPHIEHAAGTYSEHPDCWILCCQPEPKMAPDDDECRDKVDKFLNHPSRKAQLARLKELSKPEVLKQLPQGLQGYVKAVSTKWLDKKATSDDLEPVDDEVLDMFKDAGGGGE